LKNKKNTGKIPVFIRFAGSVALPAQSVVGSDVFRVLLLPGGEG